MNSTAKFQSLMMILAQSEKSSGEFRNQMFSIALTDFIKLDLDARDKSVRQTFVANDAATLKKFGRSDRENVTKIIDDLGQNLQPRVSEIWKEILSANTKETSP